jgi:hypothetical protein
MRSRFGKGLVADPKYDGQPHSCLFLSFYIHVRIEVRQRFLPDFGAPNGMPTPKYDKKARAVHRLVR